MAFLRPIILLSPVLFSVAVHPPKMVASGTQLQPLDASHQLLLADGDQGESNGSKDSSPQRGGGRS